MRRIIYSRTKSRSLENGSHDRKFDTVVKLVGLQLRRWSEEAHNFHFFASRVRQHVHLALREQDSGSRIHGFHVAVHHHLARPADDIDHFFPIGVRVRRLDGLTWRNLDHAHRAMNRVYIVLRDQPTKAAAGQVQYFHVLLVDDGYFHIRTPSRSQTVRAIAAGDRPNASISS